MAWNLAFVGFQLLAMATRCAGDEAGELSPFRATAVDSVAANIWRIVAGAGGVCIGLAWLLLWRAWRTAIKAVEPIEDVITKLAEDVPEEEWRREPTDLAKNLDHYLYDAPKASEAK